MRPLLVNLKGGDENAFTVHYRFYGLHSTQSDILSFMECKLKLETDSFRFSIKNGICNAIHF